MARTPLGVAFEKWQADLSMHPLTCTGRDAAICNEPQKLAREVTSAIVTVCPNCGAEQIIAVRSSLGGLLLKHAGLGRQRGGRR